MIYNPPNLGIRCSSLFTIVCRSNAAHLPESSHKVGIGVETTSVGHFNKTYIWISVEHIAGSLDFEMLDVGRRRITRQSVYLSIELSFAHAHIRGEARNADVFAMTDLHIYEVGYFVDEMQFYFPLESGTRLLALLGFCRHVCKFLLQ